MMLRRLFLVTMLLVVLLAGCDSNGVTDTYSKLGVEGWSESDKQHFTFEIDDPNILYNIWLKVRNDNSYSYSNLWLFVHMVPPSGEVVTDTVQILLADSRGRWLGKGFSGIFENRFAFRQQLLFPEKGTYSLEIKHGMRTPILKGISHVGLRVETSPI